MRGAVREESLLTMKCSVVPSILFAFFLFTANVIDADFRIAGYLPDYRFDSSFDINASAAVLDDLYLFSLAPQTQLGPNMFKACCLQEKHFLAAREAVEATDGRLRVWVTVGGGGRSHKFTQNPTTMLDALQTLLSERPYIGGIDFDCETFWNHEDYERYEKLVIDATSKLRQGSNNIMVSIALHAGQRMPSSLYKAVDRVNLMTYDMPGASYHADYRQMVQAVEHLVETQGCSAEKVFVGLPAYGKHKKNPADVKTYHEVVDDMYKSSSPSMLQKVKDGDDPFDLHRKYDFDGYIVDSPAAVQAKIRFAEKRGLGGAFFWELGQDYVPRKGNLGVLLEAAAQQVAKGSASVMNLSTGEQYNEQSSIPGSTTLLDSANQARDSARQETDALLQEHDEL